MTPSPMIMMRREMTTAPPVEKAMPLCAPATLSLSSWPGRPASSAIEEPRKRLKPIVVVATRLRTVFSLPGGMVGMKPSQNLDIQYSEKSWLSCGKGREAVVRPPVPIHAEVNDHHQEEDDHADEDDAQPDGEPLRPVPDEQPVNNHGVGNAAADTHGGCVVDTYHENIVRSSVYATTCDKACQLQPGIMKMAETPPAKQLTWYRVFPA